MANRSSINPRHRAVAAAFALLGVSVCPRAGLAAVAGCPGLTLAADAAFRDRARELMDHIQHAFEARADVDGCAHVDLSVASGESGAPLIQIAVALADGRAVSRQVAREEDVIPTLQALLLVPEQAPRTAPVSTAPVSTAPAPARSDLPARRRAALDDHPIAPNLEAASDATRPRDLGIELSALAGARAGDGQIGVGLGAIAFLELKGWMIGFTGRVDSYQDVSGGEAQTALALGLLTGWRVALESVAIDLTAGPALAIKGLGGSASEVRSVNASSVSNPPPSPQNAEPSSGPVPRLLVNLCLGFAPRSILRGFVGIGAEFGPAQVADSTSSVRMPEYAVGLALGATVGTL